MSDSRKKHFESLTSRDSKPSSGIWELPDHVIDEISGAADFTQGNNFAQNFACFAQGITCFSQGTPPGENNNNNR